MRLHRFAIIPALLVVLGIGSGAEPELSKRFYQSIRNNDLTSLKELLKSDIDTRDNRGATPLMYAAAFGNAETMKLLLDSGAEVNAKNEFNATALIWAAGDPLKTRMLMEHHADVNAQSRQGRTPLMMASKRDGASEVVRMILAKGGEVRAKDLQGDTALSLAAQAGDVKTMRLLLDADAEVNTENMSLGFTPLMYAISSNNLGAVTLLLAYGANVNTVSRSERRARNGLIALNKLTPLMVAAPYGSPAMIGALLRAGADVNASDIRNMAPLMLAVASETQDTRVVELLLRAGADGNVRSTTGETPLDWAMKFGSRPTIAALQKAGAKQGVPYSPVVEPHREAALDPAKALAGAVRLLQRSSTEFFKKSGCIACHHQPATAMAVRAARNAGVPVDEAAAHEQLVMMESQAAALQELALQGAGEVLDGVLSLLQGLAGAGHAPSILTDSLIAKVASLQCSDGSWRRGPAVSRAPIEESDITRTVGSVRALQFYGPPARRAEFENQIARAGAWLLKARPRTTDEYAMILLGLTWTGGSQDQIRKIARTMIAQRRADGGWAGNANLASDAFATGEVLYALHASGAVATSDQVYQRGVNFLLRTQFDDGSWHVRSRAVKFQPYFQSGFPFDHDQWISAAGTAWASVAVSAAVSQK